MVKFKINGRELEAEAGKTILDVSRDKNIYIPTLCHHESVEPYGACRLCMVEITDKRGRQKLVTSCLYPVEEGLVVQTETPRVQNVRKMVMELLLARCPEAEELQQLAKKIGASGDLFPAEQKNGDCILCSLCTRTCAHVVGQSAISLVNRGVDRQMATPYRELSDVCIACGSCAFVCPTHAITVNDKGGTRTITMPNVEMKFKLQKCKTCGHYWAPAKQLKHIIKTAELPADAFDCCPDCRS